jgi:hypothetical protein
MIIFFQFSRGREMVSSVAAQEGEIFVSPIYPQDGRSSKTDGFFSSSKFVVAPSGASFTNFKSVF